MALAIIRMSILRNFLLIFSFEYVVMRGIRVHPRANWLAIRESRSGQARQSYDYAFRVCQR
jgi:hypothetical protein